MTHRELLTWVAWLDADWERPSRTDHYLMAIAAEVRRGHVKKPNSVKPEHFKLKFARRGAAPSARDRDASSRAGWFGMMSAARGPDGKPNPMPISVVNERGEVIDTIPVVPPEPPGRATPTPSAPGRDHPGVTRPSGPPKAGNPPRPSMPAFWGAPGVPRGEGEE
jgi:hypothetical protein